MMTEEIEGVADRPLRGDEIISISAMKVQQDVNSLMQSLHSTFCFPEDLPTKLCLPLSAIHRHESRGFYTRSLDQR